MNKKYTYEEIKNYINSLGYLLLNSDYKNRKQKLTIIDNNGYYYYIPLYYLKNGQNPSAFHISNPYTINNLKLWCKLNNKKFQIYSNEYNGNYEKLKWKCSKEGCNEIFESNWQNIQSHWGCPYCSGRKVGKSNCLAIKNPKLAGEWHPTKNGDLTPYDVTCGSKKKVWWVCEKGHKWKASIHNRHCNKSNCPYCFGKLPSKENNLLKDNPELCKEWDYDKNIKSPEEYTINSNSYVWWVCKKCNYKWEANIQNRNKSGSRCPICSSSSKGEEKIQLFLKNNNIYFICQHRFSNCKNKISLPFDFYIPNLNICIEYQGIQHYQPVEYFGGEKSFLIQKEHDNIKYNYCKNNNIKLIKIPYWDFDNVEEILNRELSDVKEVS